MSGMVVAPPQTPIVNELGLQQAFEFAAASITVATMAVAIVAALRSGIIKQVRFGPLTIEGHLTPQAVKELERPSRSQGRDDKPFEEVALSNYYNHALSRANISFWFSIIFATIGFGVIIFAFATHNKDDVAGSVIKALSGTVIDAVSGLFFVQSTNAQKAMGAFFEKLRLDRLNAEARAIIGEIEQPEKRDHLREQLALKFSGIEKLITSA